MSKYVVLFACFELLIASIQTPKLRCSSLIYIQCIYKKGEGKKRKHYLLEKKNITKGERIDLNSTRS